MTAPRPEPTNERVLAAERNVRDAMAASQKAAMDAAAAIQQAQTELAQILLEES